MQMKLMFVFLSDQILGSVSAAIWLLHQLAGQHADKHDVVTAVGQRVCQEYKKTAIIATTTTAITIINHISTCAL